MMDDLAGARPVLDLEIIKLSPEDALKCLENKIDVKLPMPNVRACNNLDEYLHKSTSGSNKANNNGSSTSQPGSTQKRRCSEEPFAVPLVRNFDRILKKSHDGSQISGLVEKVRKSKPDVFTKADSTSGPLGFLKSRLDQTVKVLIRRRRKVAYISRVIEYKGTLVLFDKHMNMYLQNVIESFTFADDDDDKIIKRARHRDNILVRGDNVILVSCSS